MQQAIHRRRRSRIGLAVIALLGADVASAADEAGNAAAAGPAPTPGVTIRGFMFHPQSLTVKAGSTVTWTNRDEEPHTIASATGLFRSGAVDTNEAFSFRFDRPGTYQFICTIHPTMVGTIVVE